MQIRLLDAFKFHFPGLCLNCFAFLAQLFDPLLLLLSFTFALLEGHASRMGRNRGIQLSSCWRQFSLDVVLSFLELGPGGLDHIFLIVLK